MIVAGRVSQKMAPVVRQIYDQMPEPKWVIAMGVCASSGGMFNNYAIVQGVDHIVPVDMYLPGCPPRPEMLLDAILKLHDKIMDEPLGGNARRRELEGYAPRELVASSRRTARRARRPPGTPGAPRRSRMSETPAPPANPNPDGQNDTSAPGSISDDPSRADVKSSAPARTGYPGGRLRHVRRVDRR